MSTFARQKRQPRTYWAELGFMALGLVGLQPSIITNLLQSAPAKVASYVEQNGYQVSPESLDQYRNWAASQLTALVHPSQNGPINTGNGWSPAPVASNSYLPSTNYAQPSAYVAQQPGVGQYSPYGNQNSNQYNNYQTAQPHAYSMQTNASQPNANPSTYGQPYYGQQQTYNQQPLYGQQQANSYPNSQYPNSQYPNPQSQYVGYNSASNNSAAYSPQGQGFGQHQTSQHPAVGYGQGANSYGQGSNGYSQGSNAGYGVQGNGQQGNSQYNQPSAYNAGAGYGGQSSSWYGTPSTSGAAYSASNWQRYQPATGAASPLYR
jgi:hypothetical protein